MDKIFSYAVTTLAVLMFVGGAILAVAIFWPILIVFAVIAFIFFQGK